MACDLWLNAPIEVDTLHLFYCRHPDELVLDCGTPVSVSPFSAVPATAKDGVFYDLGCGTGKPVFVAAAMHPWQRCIGMEILGDLHGICLKVLQVRRRFGVRTCLQPGS